MTRLRENRVGGQGRVDITDEQLGLLEVIVDAYWGRPSKSTGNKIDFLLTTRGGGLGSFIEHPGLEESPRSIDFGDLEELSCKGYVRLTGTRPKSGGMVPTAEGKILVEEQRHIASVVRADAAISSDRRGRGVDWEVVLPVLGIIVDRYGDLSAGEDVSQMQVNQQLGRAEDDPGTSRAFEVLERGGYLEGRIRVDQVPGALTAAPTEKSLQLLSGWPADGAVALERLVVTLEVRIDESADEEEKGKLRAVLQAVQGIGQELAADVLAKVITGG